MSKKKVHKKGIRIHHVLILLLLLYLFSEMSHQKQLMDSLEAKKSNLGDKVEQLEASIEDIKGQIENSGTLEFVERVARDELGMVKPREIIYIDKSNPENSLEGVFDKDK
ncbi:MAG: septum formation initiator family protein [Gudongella sp.]|jgi:cell division protein FtsB|nr:septum formation initiator family protein [Gudongella sp.]